MYRSNGRAGRRENLVALSFGVKEVCKIERWLS